MGSAKLRETLETLICDRTRQKLGPNSVLYNVVVFGCCVVPVLSRREFLELPPSGGKSRIGNNNF